MTSRIGAQRPRWSNVPRGRATTAGSGAVELAASVGLFLDDWQCWWLENALAEQADGTWCSADTVLITGRQSGKNGVLAALELYCLFILGERLIVHSAHEVATALNHFQFLQELIGRSEDLSRKCRTPCLTNGREAIRLRSGAELRIRARMKNSGRGLTAPRIVFDEAFDIKPATMGALIPTTRAMPNRQFVYASSAPKATSLVLHSLIKRGRSDDLQDRIFYAEWGNPPGTAMDDVDAWYEANPALGIERDNGTFVTELALSDEYRTLVSGGNEELIAEFSREAVGIGEPPTSELKEPKLPGVQWAASAKVVRAPTGPVASLAFDVDIDGGWAATAVGLGAIGSPYVEQNTDAKGVGWLPDRIVYLVKKYSPTALGCQSNGPAAAQVGAIQKALRDEGLSIEITLLGTTECAAACGGFFTDVVEGNLTRRTGQRTLDLAGEEAAERVVSDGFVWNRRKATVPISPLWAVTIARALLPIEAPKVHTEPDFIVV